MRNRFYNAVTRTVQWFTPNDEVPSEMRDVNRMLNEYPRIVQIVVLYKDGQAFNAWKEMAGK